MSSFTTPVLKDTGKRWYVEYYTLPVWKILLWYRKDAGILLVVGLLFWSMRNNMPLNAAIAGAEAWSNFKIADHKNTPFGITYVDNAYTNVTGASGLIQGPDVQTLTNNVAALAAQAVNKKKLPNAVQNIVVAVDVVVEKTLPQTGGLSQYLVRVSTTVGGIVDRTTGAAVPCDYASKDYWDFYNNGGGCNVNPAPVGATGAPEQMMLRLNQLGCGYTSYRAALIPHLFLQVASNPFTQFRGGNSNPNATPAMITAEYEVRDLFDKHETGNNSGLGTRECLDPNEMLWHTGGAFRVATNPYYANQVIPQPNTGSWLVLSYTIESSTSLCTCHNFYQHALIVTYGKETVLPQALLKLIGI